MTDQVGLGMAIGVAKDVVAECFDQMRRIGRPCYAHSAGRVGGNAANDR